MTAARGNDRSTNYAVPAAEKAFDILGLLSRKPDGLSVAEIGNLLGRSMGEIYRIVVFLTERELIAQDAATERYYLTGQLFEMVHSHPPTERLLALASPELQRLAIESEQSCHLAVLDREAVLIVATADSPLPMHYRVRVGARFEAVTTSSGAVLLAGQNDDTWERWLSALDKKDRDATLGRLRGVRGRGFERIRSLMVDGVTNISYPVYDHRGKTVAAMTIPYLMQATLTVSLDAAQKATAAAAKRLSMSLGFKNPSSK